MYTSCPRSGHALRHRSLGANRTCLQQGLAAGACLEQKVRRLQVEWRGLVISNIPETSHLPWGAYLPHNVESVVCVTTSPLPV